MKHPPLARKLLALGLSLLLVLSFLPTAFAEGEVIVKTEQELLDAIANASGPTVIRIEGTVTIAKTLVIDGGRKITLTGDGTIAAASNFTISHESMIYISGEGTALTVECEVAGNASRSAYCSVLYATNSADLTLNDGADIHGGYAGNGGGVRVTRGDTEPGTFTMNGGSIHDNEAGNGAGLSLDNQAAGQHLIRGGSITKNRATGTGYAGGIWVGSEVGLTMTGGEVTGNTAKSGTIYEGIVVNSNDSTKSWTGVYITSGKVTADIIRIEGDSNTNGLTARLQISSGATLNGDVSIGFNTYDLVEDKLKNEGTINGDVSLEARTGLTNTGTINGKVTVDGEDVVIDNNNGAGQILGGVEGNATIPEGSTNTITATAGPNGSISPSGTVSVQTGGSQTFAITAAGGYNIQDVRVDGTSVGAVSSYTFDNVFANHTITASFVRNNFIEPTYYPDYDEDVDYLPPAEDEEAEEAPEETQDLYMVTCRTLNVRLGGGTGYARIGTLSRGTLVSGELEDGWLKFSYDGGTAYCSADYLARVDGDLTDMHVTCRTLNVRAGAGTNFEILGTLSRGTEVEILDVLPGWYEIEYLGGVGYVSAAYIG